MGFGVLIVWDYGAPYTDNLYSVSILDTYTVTIPIDKDYGF
jgi:hypothetical protein